MTEHDNWPSLDGCFALVHGELRDDQNWRLTSWWYAPKSEPPRLLFGWTFAWNDPEGAQTAGTWRVAYNQTPRIRRLDIQLPRPTMFVMLERLAQGDTLEEAASNAGLEPAAGAVQALLAKARVCSPADSSGAPEFVVAPWRILPSRWGLSTEGPASPLEYEPAMRSALVRVDKTAVLPGRDEEVRAVLAHLSRDCGLAFQPCGGASGRDIGRLGDLELLVFARPPSAEQRDDILTLRPGGEFIELELAPSFLEPKQPALIRWRQTHGGAVLDEGLASLPPSESPDVPRALRFPTISIGPSGADVEVWVEDSAREQYTLIHSSSHAWIRQVGFRLAAMGTRIEFPAAWIDDWVKQRRETVSTKARADAMRRISNTFSDNESRVGQPDELWHTAETNAKRMAALLAPSDSEAKWFPRGYDSVEGGKLDVGEWFRALVSEASAPRSYLIVDPYFYTLGLDLIARASGPGRRFVVVTTLDDNKDDAQTKRQTLLRAQKELAKVLPNLSVELYVVTDKKIHDRMLFELEASDDTSQSSPVRGFHLSNSLQRATDNYPLLVTPIPSDVLSNVVDGVAELIEGLAPLQEDPNEASPEKGLPQAIETTEEAKPPAVELEAELRKTLEDNDDTGFARLFPLVLEARADRHDLSNLTWTQHPNFLVLLEQLLISWRPAKPTRDAQQSIGLAQLTRRAGFGEWSATTTLWTHGHWSAFGDIVLCAGYPLLRAAPDRFVRAWEAACRAPNPESMDDQAQRGAVLESILEVVHRDYAISESQDELIELLTAGLRSEELFVRRAVAAALGLLQLEDKFTPATGRSTLEAMGSPRERVLTIATWVSELRVHANRNNSRESPKLESLRKAWMSWMVEWWPSSFTRSDLDFIADACDGPGRPGAWSLSTTSDLLIPLNNAGLLHASSVADLWLGMLEDRLEACMADDHHFYAPADIRLSELCIWLLSGTATELVIAEQAGEAPDAFDERIQSSLGRLSKLHSRAKAKHTWPFLRGLNYKTWQAADDTRVWLSALASMLALTPGSTPRACDAAEAWVSEDGIRERVDKDPTKLRWWAATLLDRLSEAESAGPAPRSPDRD